MVPILPIVIKDMERSSLIVILPENKKVKHCQTEKGDRPKPPARAADARLGPDAWHWSLGKPIGHGGAPGPS